LPSLSECIETHLLMGRRTNPRLQCVGISVNTSALPAGQREKYLADLCAETGLPCVDPLIDGCSAIVNHIQKVI
jgi:uncharacterized NAD-dependent epimerase/dehydratase family protein